MAATSPSQFSPVKVPVDPILRIAVFCVASIANFETIEFLWDIRELPFVWEFVLVWLRAAERTSLGVLCANICCLNRYDTGIILFCRCCRRGTLPHPNLWSVGPRTPLDTLHNFFLINYRFEMTFFIVFDEVRSYIFQLVIEPRLGVKLLVDSVRDQVWRFFQVVMRLREHEICWPWLKKFLMFFIAVTFSEFLLASPLPTLILCFPGMFSRRPRWIRITVDTACWILLSSRTFICRNDKI